MDQERLRVSFFLFGFFVFCFVNLDEHAIRKFSYCRKDTFFKDVKEANAGVGQDMDPSVMFYPEPYCQVVKNMKTACFETRLELFQENNEIQSS